MHNNYYFLKALSRSLHDKLTGWELVACFSQVKNELIFAFLNGNSEFYIKAYLQPDFSCLFLPSEFARANKNTANIFEEAIGKRVIEVIQYNQERAFGITLEDELIIVFKLFGNRSNVVLFKKGITYKLFKNILSQDKALKLDDLHRSINQSFETFLEKAGDSKSLFPTFGKLVNNHLKKEGLDDLSLKDQWKTLTAIHSRLENADEFYVTRINETPALSLLQVGDIFFKTHDPIAAINNFFIAYTKDFYLEREKLKVEKYLEQLLGKTRGYIKKADSKLQEIQMATGYDKIADIIMANLHQIPKQESIVELYDFYNDGKIKIKLNKNLSPQKNAENYYRKSKNQKKEIETLSKNIAYKRDATKDIASHLENIKIITTTKDLRQYLKENALLAKREESEKELPFKVFNIDGWQILIGKNAKNNDLLTHKFSFKDDLWLHAKDVTGSHAILKYQSGKIYPKYIIEKAAQLAAYYSQRKSDSLCPVIVTPKKFVRKPKGAAPGAVIVDKEEVLLVRPSAYDEL